MSKFNKLYNLILLSIISLSSASRKAMLLKSDIGKGAAELWMKYLTRLNNNKLADFLCKYVADGTIEDGLDKRIDIVLKILKLNDSIDTQSYKGSLDLFIKQHKTIIKKALAKLAVKTILYLDSIPLFTLKRLYKYGVVTYKVLDSKKGQEAVRKIIDLQWGEDANPWCLASRSGDGLDINYKKYWAKTYNAYPKAIAFQNGKLLAFSANGNDLLVWWDRNDQPTRKLKTLDEKKITTKPYTFKDIFEKYSDLRFNEETKRYDYSGTLELKNEDLVDGHFPVPFGIIKGDFNCFNCTDLIDLSNGPTDVVCAYKLQICPNLTSLKGMSNIVGGSVYVELCPKLTNLLGAPEYVGGSFFVMKLSNLKSLKGSPKEVRGSYVCSDNENLTSLEDCSKKIGNNFDCSDCKNLISLKGSPKKIKGDFHCYHCTSLTSLVGGPEEVGGHYNCSNELQITNLIGAPKIVNGSFDCSYNDQLETLDGAPDEVRGRFYNHNCPKLKVSKMYGARFKIPSNL